MTTTCTCEGAAHREAARYRRRLRDAEAERDRLRDQVQALERAMAELARAFGSAERVPSDPLDVFNS